MDGFKNGHMTFRSEKDDYMVHVEEALQGVFHLLRTQGVGEYDNLTIREFVNLIESRVEGVMTNHRKTLFEISQYDVDKIPPEAS